MKSIQVYEGDGVARTGSIPWVSNYIEKKGETITVDDWTAPAEITLKTSVDQTMISAGLPSITDIDIEILISAEYRGMIDLLEDYFHKSNDHQQVAYYKFSAVALKDGRKISLSGCFIIAMVTVASIDGTNLVRFKMKADRTYEI